MEALGVGGFTLAERQRLAAEAFVHTATYDTAVANWMGTVVADTTDGTGFPAWTGATWDRAAALRYGENPHQPAALYRHWRPGIAHAEQLHGKGMSYNNYVDADAAVRAAHDHGDQPTVAIIKHANPCGIAVGETLVEAYDKAHACDPQSAYGGIIATNQTVTAEMVEHTKGVFTEVIVAPDFDDDALVLLRARKNIRVLRLPADMDRFRDPIEVRPISGGILVQTPDRVDAVVRGEDGEPTGGDDEGYWRLVAGDPADEATLADLAFAWRAIRAVKSNAILLAEGRRRRRRRHGPGQPRGLVPPRRVAGGRRAGCGGRGRLRRVLPVHGRAGDPPRRRGPGGRGARRLDPRRGHRRGRQRAGVTMYFTGTRHFAH